MTYQNNINVKICFKILTFYFFTQIVFLSCSDDDKVYRTDLKKVFDSAGYDGCFVLYNNKTGVRTYINQSRAMKQFSPASTFKILNSLIALETGSVKSLHDTIKYNGIPKEFPDWNRDHDMQSAFKYSVVWYYQDIANRIGDSAMKFWLDTIKDYGTMGRAGTLDRFWLDGSLVISADEQVNFLTNLVNNRLPFTERYIDSLKQIMLFENNPNYRIYAKTGSNNLGKIGWFVGWVEKNDNSFVFATNISAKDSLDNRFLSNRVIITKKLLNILRAI